MRRSLQFPASLCRQSCRRVILLSSTVSLSSPLSSCPHHATAASPLWSKPSGSFHGISSDQVRFFSADNVDSPTKVVEPDAASSVVVSSQDKKLMKAKQSLDQLCRRSSSSDDDDDRLEAADEAERILRDMEDSSFFPQILLPVKDYHRVLELFIARKRIGRAHNLLLTMKQTPTNVGFAIVAKAWIRQGQLSKAEELLTVYVERGIAETLCFNILMTEYANSRRNFQPEKAVELLHTMDAYARNGHPEAKPDKMTMASIMTILAKRGQALEAEALLQRMFDSKDPDMAPDAIIYSLVFKAYAKNSTDAASPERAHALLETMEERYKVQKELAVKPNTVVYNTFLLVLANAGDGERAEAFLKQMEAREDLDPDTISYGTVLTAWKNAGNGERAEQLLWRVPNPDRTCFNITIAALAKQGDGQGAETILYAMYQNGREELRPTTHTHTAVLNAWANSKDPNAFGHAKRVLYEMGKMQNGHIDTAVFNSFLRAVGNSSEPDKVDMVLSVLQRMKKMKSAIPNSSTYRQAILAIAATNGNVEVKQDALHVALQIYQDRTRLPAKEQKDLKLHTAMLEACGKLSPKGVHGDEIAETVFRSCCKEGVVNSLFTMLLNEAASEELLKRIFNTDTLDREVFHVFPESWSRNRNRKQWKGNEKDDSCI